VCLKLCPSRRAAAPPLQIALGDDRSILVGVSSHAALLWYASFQPAAGAAFVRYLDGWNTTSGALFTGAGGAWGLVLFPPATTVRIETSGNVLAVTSFCLVEVVR
jgi:hypothetical protein